jgi:hypothetical protein
MSTLDASLALKLIPNFDGRSDQLLEFIEMSEVVHSTATMPADENLFMSLIFSKLEGKAFEFARSAVHANWLELKTALKKKYASTKSVPVLQQDLAQLRQTGSVEDYGTAIIKNCIIQN